MSIPRRGAEIAGWIVLTALLMAGLPLHVCMPPWLDVTLYDMAARTVLRGGVHYRDIYDNNLPGIVWIHMAICAMFGYRSEVIRLTDAMIVGASIYLLTRWLAFLGASRLVCVWAAVVLLFFYFSTPESCHCQRDVWMLLPALGAMSLRRSQTEELIEPKLVAARVMRRSALEGLCWGTAVWIKPFVVVPALGCWVVSAVMVGQYANRWGKRLTLDATALLGGGLIAGGLGIAWMLHSGSWGPFWHIYRNWNAEYYASHFGVAERIAKFIEHFRTWGLVHLVAPWIALYLIGRAIMQGQASSTVDRARALFASGYLGWLGQAIFLQHPHAYVAVPAALLAWTLILAAAAGLQARWLRLAVVCGLAGCLGMAVVGHPLLTPSRLALWPRCWHEGSSAELRNRLTLTKDVHTPAWVGLEKVALFLANEHVGDHELTCYSNSTHPLYLMLNIEPAVPIMHFDSWVAFYPDHLQQLRDLIADSSQRYVVSDLITVPAVRSDFGPLHNMPDDLYELPPNFPPRWRSYFPWNEPVVFRSGRYVVHRVTEPVAPLVPREMSVEPPRPAR
jgi:hypothetical protein